MKKFLAILVALLFIGFNQTIEAETEQVPLQPLIDETKPGDTLYLPPGEYIGGAVINKPIHIIGDDQVTILPGKKGPVIQVKANQVIIENISIMDQRNTNDETVYITGDDNELKKLNIKTNGVGIQLFEANDNKLYQLKITGNKNLSLAQRGNGIDLWDSDHNTIHSSQITDVQDGVYLEKSSQNDIYNNIVTHSRYGYHLMFTNKTTLTENESYYNVSGMMVMGTNGTVVKHNELKHNLKSVQSLGLLLFDVKNAQVAHNKISHNKVGLFIENAHKNDITLNELEQNFVGVQFLKSTENSVTKNAFLANVVQGQAERSSDNDTESNFWGDHIGVDVNGDGYSQLSYQVDPFYLSLTKEYPPFQIYFQAPGMQFLEQLFHAPTDQWLSDQSPLMDNPIKSETEAKTSSIYVLCFSIILFIASTTIIYMGARKK